MPKLDKQLRKLLAGNDNALNIPSVNIGDGTFTPVQFTPQEYTPQQEDLTLLANSLNKMEERKEKLDTQKLAVAEAFSKAREVLPDNEETNAYITENQNRVMNDINSMIDLGDMSNALSVAKRSAADFVSSAEFVGRTKHYKERKEWLEKLDRVNTPEYIKDYYKDLYSEIPTFTRNEQGKVTGVKAFEEHFPEVYKSPTDIITQAVSRTADERTDTSTAWSGPGGGGSNSFKSEKLTAEKISNTAISIINNNPNIRKAYVDQFNAGIHQINKLKKELNNTKDPVRRAEIQNEIDGYENIFYENYAPISSAEMFINKMFNKDNSEIKNAAYEYNHKATSSSVTKGTSSSSDDKTINVGNTRSGGDLENGGHKGANARVQQGNGTMLMKGANGSYNPTVNLSNTAQRYGLVSK